MAESSKYGSTWWVVTAKITILVGVMALATSASLADKSVCFSLSKKAIADVLQREFKVPLTYGLRTTNNKKEIYQPQGVVFLTTIAVSRTVKVKLYGPSENRIDCIEIWGKLADKGQLTSIFGKLLPICVPQLSQDDQSWLVRSTTGPNVSDFPRTGSQQQVAIEGVKVGTSFDKLRDYRQISFSLSKTCRFGLTTVNRGQTVNSSAFR